MNINGKNGLACVTPLSEAVKRDKLVLKPMPGLPVVRDLIVDMKQFFDQLEKVKPYLITKDEDPEQERMQSPEEREEWEKQLKWDRQEYERRKAEGYYPHQDFPSV